MSWMHRSVAVVSLLAYLLTWAHAETSSASAGPMVGGSTATYTPPLTNTTSNSPGPVLGSDTASRGPGTEGATSTRAGPMVGGSTATYTPPRTNTTSNSPGPVLGSDTASRGPGTEGTSSTRAGSVLGGSTATYTPPRTNTTSNSSGPVLGSDTASRGPGTEGATSTPLIGGGTGSVGPNATAIPTQGAHRATGHVGSSPTWTDASQTAPFSSTLYVVWGVVGGVALSGCAGWAWWAYRRNQSTGVAYNPVSVDTVPV